MSAIFLLSGVGKLAAPAATLGMIKAAGLPLPEVSYAAAAFVEVVGGILLVAGYQTRIVALVLAAFSLATAVTFHTAFADQNQMIHFLKNVAMAGGLLQIAAFAPDRSASMPAGAGLIPPRPPSLVQEPTMPFITTQDGTEIFFKDWGPKDAQPIVFHHGWPLSSDDWDAQMLFFVQHGYRVVAHDRRGSWPLGPGPVGPRHGPIRRRRGGGGAASRPAQRRPYRPFDRGRRGGALRRPARRARGPRRQGGARERGDPADAENAGQPGRLADRGVRRLPRGARGQPRPVLSRCPDRPILRVQPERGDASAGVIQNWWRQGMMGSALAHYEGIKAFSETDQTDDLKAIGVPVLVLHGEDDQIVPIADAALKAITHLRHGTLKTYPGYGHGMLTVNADVLNADLLAFVRS